jgi:hypothetical protein
MKRLLFALLFVCVIGCGTQVTIDLGHLGSWSTAPSVPKVDYPAYERELPTVNLEHALRQQNWRGDQGEGSCVYASMVMLFRWQGRFDIADRWRKEHGDGTGYFSLADEMDKEDIKYAYTWRKKDVAFLEWACNTRRGCGVTVTQGSHMVCLVYIDSKKVGILDNNTPEKIIWRDREGFLKEWFEAYSWAVVPLMGTVPPPLPFSEQVESYFEN